MFLILLGPSGVGKTSLGDYLASHHGFLHLNVDVPGEPRLDELQMRPEMEQLILHQNSLPLLEKFSGNTVMTLPSHPTFRDIHRDLKGITIRYLWGSPAHVVPYFLEREIATGRNFKKDYWDHHNRHVYSFFAHPTFPPEWRLDAFTPSGQRKSLEELAQAIL